MSKHTPGPWKVEVLGHTLRVVDSYGWEEHSNDLAVIGDCSNPTLQANTRLIAAAPDLLEALEMALNAIESSGIESKRGDATVACRMSRTAIAKAKGETK